MKERNKCPKCGFYMTDNYCLKCGFAANIYLTNLEKYDESVSDLELLMKSQFQKCIYNENLFLIFLIGPFYFSLNMHFLISIILIFIDCFFGTVIGIFFSKGIFPVIIYFFLLRVLYVMFSNELLILLNKVKIKKIKSTYEDYRKILIAKKSYSIMLPFLVILFYMILIFLIVLIYKKM